MASLKRPLNYAELVTRQVVSDHWDPILKQLVFAATSALVLGRSDESECCESDASVLTNIISQLGLMGLRLEAMALDDKIEEVLQFWSDASARVGKKDQTDAEEIRFQSDRWRYQKEARQYYNDPAGAFATELLQNSLDAMNKLGVGHTMVISCSIEEVGLAEQRRVVVTFSDNGSGMTRDIVQGGLLKIGASAATRTDAGRKGKLTDSAGGFGLAKVLLYLGQSGFKIWTKMADSKELFVSAELFRKDQEVCKIRAVKEGEEHMFGTGRQHGTKVSIYLDPWVMELHAAIPEISEDFYTDHFHLKSQYSSSADFERKFRAVWQKSNLPIQLSLNSGLITLNADVGQFQAFILMPGTLRRFAVLYAKVVKDSTQKLPPVKILLQTLSNRLPQGHDFKEGSGYFLYLFDFLNVNFDDVALTKQFELSVLLLSRDQFDEPFNSGDLLKGTRDALVDEIKKEISHQVQAYIIDRFAVRPPVAKQTWYTSKKNRSFTDWMRGGGDYDTDDDQLPRSGNTNRGGTSQPARSPEWWSNAQQKDADSFFKNKHWRKRVPYNFVMYQDPFMSDFEVPYEFKDISKLRPKDMMWLELFGVLVLETLEIFKREVTTARKSSDFDIGFWLGDHLFVRPVYANGRPVFLFNKSYVQNIGGMFDSSSLDAIQTTMACVKNMVIRQITYLLHGYRGAVESFQLFERNYLKFEQRTASQKWSWFQAYKKRVEVRYMRELQDGSSAECLKKQVVAMQCPVKSDSSIEMLQSERDRLRAELDELHDAESKRREAEEAEEEPEMPDPLTSRERMDPRLIRYSQDSCASRFQCRRSLRQTTLDLKDGAISADLNIPIIEVFKWNGQWHSTGNRRLKAFKDAGLTSVPVKRILLADVWKGRLTTKNRGQSITVR